MTCPTCKREDVSDECGCQKIGDECRCCGMVVIASATQDLEEDTNNVEGQSGGNNN